MNKLNSPLVGIKVIEFATVLAGPAVGMFLAELGAEVIKIEPKKNKGDVTRSWKLKNEDPKHPFSAYYSSVNYGKESLFVNLENAAELEMCRNLIKEADIVLTNFKSHDAKKYALDFIGIKSLQPSIILGEIKGFNQSERLAYDLVMQAESGMLSINGLNKDSLCKLPIAFIDLFAAHQLKEGILIALLRQRYSRKAKHVSVSLFDSALSSLANQASNWYVAYQNPQAVGMLHPNIAPYGEMFNTKDNKKMVLAIGNNRQFERLLDVLNLSNLHEDPHFKENQERVKNRAILYNFLKIEIEKWESLELQNVFNQEGIPGACVKSIKEVFEDEAVRQKILTEEKEGYVLKSYPSVAFTIKE
tara:strand:+ start:36 stop:1115 length:1080 start_codon:yes stop_codon:yes gene_type:complete